jgi:transcription termination factor Rho
MKEQEQQRLFKEMSHYKSRCIDLMCEIDELKKKRAYWEMRCKQEQEKIKQALSQRNKKILEIIEKEFKYLQSLGYNKLTEEVYKFKQRIKQQLTTNSEGKA